MLYPDPRSADRSEGGQGGGSQQVEGRQARLPGACVSVWVILQTYCHHDSLVVATEKAICPLRNVGRDSLLCLRRKCGRPCQKRLLPLPAVVRFLESASHTPPLELSWQRLSRFSWKVRPQFLFSGCTSTIPVRHVRLRKPREQSISTCFSKLRFCNQ